MIADLIRRMTEAGAPMEAVMIAVEAIETLQRADQERREKRAAQKRKERGGDVARLSRDNEATVAPMSRDKNEDPHTPKEKTPPVPSPPKGGSVRPPAGGLDDPKTILAAVLPIETAAEVIAHRSAMKAPLTAGSARGLARNFAACGDPVAGAQAMMAGGWRGFKPEWMANTPARAGPFRSTDGVTSILSQLEANRDRAEPSETRSPLRTANGSHAGVCRDVSPARERDRDRWSGPELDLVASRSDR